MDLLLFSLLLVLAAGIAVVMVLQPRLVEKMLFTIEQFGITTHVRRLVSRDRSASIVDVFRPSPDELQRRLGLRAEPSFTPEPVVQAVPILPSTAVAVPVEVAAPTPVEVATASRVAATEVAIPSFSDVSPDVHAATSDGSRSSAESPRSPSVTSTLLSISQTVMAAGRGLLRRMHRVGGAPASPPAVAVAGGPAAVDADNAVDARPELGCQPAAWRILQGDRAVLDRLVAALASQDPDNTGRWQQLLEEFFEAVLERALDVGVVNLPSTHPFWGMFTREQGRQVLTALASLGYRFDGLDGWLDGRYPNRRDLTLAVGYAGVDPVRIRSWPAPAEAVALVSQASIAGDEYLAQVAPTLEPVMLAAELTTHGDSLAELWREWDRLRPLLLAQS